MYGRPNSCLIVSTQPPEGVSKPGSWALEDEGKGTSVTGHDHETRDCCYAQAAAPAPPAYIDIGNGFCTGPSGRPQTFLCDTTGGKQGCPSTKDDCAKVCTATASCAGFMTQTMSSNPDTCNVVSGHKPSGSGSWVIGQVGAGLEITGHDSETRDHCYKRSQRPSPPPAPPAPPAPSPLAPAPPSGSIGGRCELRSAPGPASTGVGQRSDLHLNDGFCIKMMNSVLTMMNFVLMVMDFALKR